jgi:hypothetical protein
VTFAELEAQLTELERQLARVAHERDENRKLYELASIELKAPPYRRAEFAPRSGHKAGLLSGDLGVTARG